MHRPATHFPPTRAEALARLERFLPRAGRHYATRRNEDRGPGDRAGVSLLSPYIRHRMITERAVLAAVLARHPLEEASKFVEEVLWRTYWKGWLQHRPGVFEHYRLGLLADRAELAREIGLRRRYEEAIEGRTGIEGFDDWARELVETGYLHNHARMWFSSIWIFTLRLPWRLGAEFFMRHLLDGDPASNTLSWRWTAGLHTPGKTYLARRDNIARYTGGRFSPDNLARRADPLVEEPPPPPRLVPSPDPVPATEIALLVTEEDLSPESWALDGARVRAILLTSGVDGRTPDGASPNVRHFVGRALEDARIRAQDHFDVPAMIVPLEASAIAAAARQVGARALVTAEAATGPVAGALAVLRVQLADEGLPLARIARPFDRRFWPHATRGFFAFRKEIPTLLAEELGAPLGPDPSP